MTESTTLNVSPRDVIGKSAHRLAPAGLIPAVLYGHGREPLPLSVDRHEFEMLLAHHAAGAALVSLKIEGHSKPVSAMLKEVQMSPVKTVPIHIDFLEVSMDEAVHASVSIHLVGESPGVKAGGLLVTNMHSLNIEAKAKDLPEVIEVDISGLQVGTSLHVGDVVPPAGIRILDDPEGIICSVGAAHVVTLEEEEAEAAAAAEEAEPELIGRKSDEEE